MSASAQSIDHSAHRPSTSMTHQESPADRELAARVARFASQDRLFKAVTFLFAMLVLLGMFGILASLLVEAWPTLRTTGVAFFYGTTWSPTDDEYGAVIAIYGTVVTSAIALLIAVPVSFGIAMFLTESCPVVLRRPLGTAIELLAGVPSIIYGIWGLFVLAPLFQQYVQPLLVATGLPFFAGPPLVSRVRNSQAKPLNAGQNVIGGFGPHERLGVGIVTIEVLANRLLELTGGSMRAPTQVLLSERGEPAFDLVEPRGRGRREVDLESWMSSKPGTYRRGFVGGVVVHHQMHVQPGRDIGLDRAQEAEKLAGTMTPMGLTNHLAGGDIERRKQRRCAVTHVVVRTPLGGARGHGQDGLRAVQRLDLALLVHAQNHSLRRWVQVQPDDVAHLLDKQRVGGQLEGLLAMRLQAERTPDARDGCLRHLHLAGHRARAPVRGVARHGFQRASNHHVDLGVIDGSRRACARRIQQPVQTLIDEALTPLRDGLLCDVQVCGHRLIGQALRAAQHDARTQRQGLRCLTAQRPGLKLLALVLCQHQLCLWSSSHRLPHRVDTLHERWGRFHIIQSTFNSEH